MVGLVWWCWIVWLFFFFFQAEDGIRDDLVTGVQTCALPIFEPNTSPVRHDECRRTGTGLVKSGLPTMTATEPPPTSSRKTTKRVERPPCSGTRASPAISSEWACS